MGEERIERGRGRGRSTKDGGPSLYTPATFMRLEHPRETEWEGGALDAQAREQPGDVYSWRRHLGGS
jgi:hypothetical protein